MKTTSVQCEIKFSFLKGGYHPKINLFKNEWVELKGAWKPESVTSFCKEVARKRGFSGVTLEIYYYDEDFNESSLNLEI